MQLHFKRFAQERFLEHDTQSGSDFHCEILNCDNLDSFFVDNMKMHIILKAIQAHFNELIPVRYIPFSQYYMNLDETVDIIALGLLLFYKMCRGRGAHQLKQCTKNDLTLSMTISGLLFW